MSSLLFQTIDQLSREKGIEPQVIISAVEDAMLVAARKYYKTGEELRSEVNRETGQVEVFAVKKVVEQVQNPLREISLEEARELQGSAELEGEIRFSKPTDVLGRIAAQTAKQVIFQKVREAERENVYNEYSGRVGELVHCMVKRTEGPDVIVELGKTEARLPRREQSKLESFQIGERIRAVILQVEKASRGPQVVISRADAALVSRLFEMEVPEIYDGTVVIRAVAREAGERTKIAVFSKDRDVDCVGACVGMKGARVQSVVQELRGERIDIIPWSQDQAKYVCSALSPAKISRVYIDEENRHMEVVVPDDQLSLAIGKRGQNVRLASKLTGWKIDIKSESRMEKISSEILESFKGLPHLGDVTSRILYNEGFRSIKEVSEVDPDELSRVLEIEKEKAVEIVDAAIRILSQAGAPVPEEERPAAVDPSLDPVERMEGVGEKTAEVLEANGLRTVQDVLKAGAEKLSSLQGIGAKKADKLIETAQRYIEEKKA